MKLQLVSKRIKHAEQLNLAYLYKDMYEKICDYIKIQNNGEFSDEVKIMMFDKICLYVQDLIAARNNRNISQNTFSFAFQNIRFRILLFLHLQIHHASFFQRNTFSSFYVFKEQEKQAKKILIYEISNQIFFQICTQIF